MIEKLIEEMHSPCHYCQGSGVNIYVDEEGQTTSATSIQGECEQCNGSGKILSYEGEKLRHLILKGELP